MKDELAFEELLEQLHHEKEETKIQTIKNVVN